MRTWTFSEITGCVEDERFCLIVDVDQLLPADEADRNAIGYKIAAVHELFEACQAAIAYMDSREGQVANCADLLDLVRRAHAPLRAKLEPAIAKAQGR